MPPRQNTRGSARRYYCVAEIVGQLFGIRGSDSDALKNLCDDGISLIRDKMQFPYWRYNGVKETKKDVKFNFRCGKVQHRKNQKCPMNRQLVFDKTVLFKNDNRSSSYKWIVQVTEGIFKRS
jgi:hypothetical protein